MIHINSSQSSTNCLNRIYQYLKDHGTSEDYTTALKDEFEYIKGMLGTTPVQSMLLACILESSFTKAGTSTKQICNILGCTNIEFLNYSQELDDMVRRRILRPTTTMTPFSDSCGYIVSKRVIDAIKGNEALKDESVSGLSAEEFFSRMSRLFKEYSKDALNLEELAEALKDMVKQNSQLAFCHRILSYDLSSAENFEFLIFLYLCDNYVSQGEDSIPMEGVLPFLGTMNTMRHILTGFRNRRLMIQKKGLVEYGNNDGMTDTKVIVLSEMAKRTLFTDIDLELDTKKDCPILVESTSIAARDLFFNESCRTQVDRLRMILDDGHFKDIQSRLETASMRKGFNCIFYGAPGTGKTETVYQLARETGRDILPIDLSKMKSKWVGESERIIRSVFSHYQWILSRRSIAPILLFNEADGVFGIRTKGAEGSVDKMNNTIQDIILQEMERMEGIMIATTNLTENLDPAFERRFLYKVEFTIPDRNTRSCIWKSLMPSLTNDAASFLADKYHFSGGQIENISRKCVIEFILNGVEATLDEIEALCGEESYSINNRPRIGF